MAVNHIVRICKYRADKSERLQMRNSHSHTHAYTHTHIHTHTTFVKTLRLPMCTKGEKINLFTQFQHCEMNDTEHHTDFVCACVWVWACACFCVCVSKSVWFHTCVKEMTVMSMNWLCSHQTLSVYDMHVYELLYCSARAASNGSYFLQSNTYHQSIQDSLETRMGMYFW